MIATLGTRTKFQNFEPVREHEIPITSDTLRAALLTMRRQKGSPELEGIIQALSEDENAQQFLARLLESNPRAFRDIKELTAAVDFYRAHPSWWSQSVESHCETFSDALRERIPDGLARDHYDVNIGVAKGLYTFSVDLLMLIPSLLGLGYRLFTDDKTQNEAWEMTKKLSLFYFHLRFGSLEQKRKALSDASDLVSKVVLALWEQVKTDWEKARKEGKEDEYVAKMATLGILEILTAGIGVAKGPKAVKAMGEMAHAADYASKAAKATALTKLKKLSEPLRMRRRLALAKKYFPQRNRRFLEEFAAIDGKVVGKFDATTEAVQGVRDVMVGKLRMKDAKTFSGGRYLEIILREDLVVHRAWANGTYAREFGAFWSVRKPRGTLGAKIESALLPEWGSVEGKPWFRSQATRTSSMKIPKGTKIYFGEAADMGGIWNGASSQLLIDGKIDPSWKIGLEEVLK